MARAEHNQLALQLGVEYIGSREQVLCERGRVEAASPALRATLRALLQGELVGRLGVVRGREDD